MAGEGEEDLVETRLAEREVGDGDAGVRERGEGRRSPVGVGEQGRGAAIDQLRADVLPLLESIG